MQASDVARRVQPPTDDRNALRTRYVTALDDGRLRCDVCPRACALRDGQSGLCFVRARRGGDIVLTTYGRSSGFCVDPIEKKPLHHFLPGSAVLSFGTAGCNLTCRFCQNWSLSTSRAMDTVAEDAPPDAIASAAAAHGCRSVAFTYNDPTIFLEYAIDTARACHERGIRTVAVSAGYMQAAARRDLYAAVDAANIDLKGFRDDFYRRLCGARLRPVLDTLEYLVHDTPVWVEITTLLIPGHNDSDAEIDALTGWVARHLGVDVPLHFSAFHPAHKLRDVPATPAATLRRARTIAHGNGLRFVATGNVHDPAGQATACPGCGEVVIARDGYRLRHYRLDDTGRCLRCAIRLPGVFDGPAGAWGSRRLPLRVGSER